MNEFNFYNHLKNRARKDFLNQEHFWNLINVLMARFEYSGLPDNIPVEFIECYLISNGTCCFGRPTGSNDIYVGCGGYCGDIRGYLPESYTASIPGVGTIMGNVGADIVVGWNNATRVPELDVFQYSSILSEIDISENINVIYSRLLRIPMVQNQREKTAVESAIRAIIDGKIESVISDNIRSQLLGDESKNDKFLDLVDVDAIKNLQYLNQYRDNIIKRFFQKYGQGMQTTSKLAQQTNDEIHGNDAVSMIYTLSCLKYRQKMCDDLNNLFGWNCNVSLSDCWIDSYTEIIQGVENPAIENEMGMMNNDDSDSDTQID